LFLHVKNREAIREKFADFQTKACVKLEEIGVNIGEFRLFVTSQFSPGHFIPSLPTSLKEVFEEITHHEMWDYFHYSPLVRIIRKFGDGDPEMEVLIQKYRKDLKSYKLVTKIEDCIEAELDADTDLLQQRAPSMTLAISVQWNGKLILILLTTPLTISPTCGKCSLVTTFCLTPHPLPCLTVFAQAVFLSRGLFHQA